jgi:pilus assembly protein CpaC
MILCDKNALFAAGKRGLYLGLVMAGCMHPGFAQQVDEMKLTVGKSIVLDYPADIRQISTSDPSIVDAIAVSTREILLHAKSNGSATVVVWSRAGQRNIYSITVEQNLDPLRKLIKETFPNEDIQVQSSKDSLSITGRATTKEVADRVVAMVAPFGKSIVNNLRINVLPVDKQILIRVKFAELDRNVGTQFGVNLASTGAGNTIARTTTGVFTPPVVNTNIKGGGALSISDALNIFAFRPDLNLAVLIRALKQQGVLQILAEPNLVTTNGREASFLVGGEFPVPILQGGGNAGAVTVQFREFGIRLTFTPTLTENGTIKMYVRPEVSTIDLANAVRISGFLIPALATRRMETNIELGEGQSFVIGGLIDDRANETFAKIPGLANIPLLGTLFTTREKNKSRTELIVMVTPEITTPLAATDPKPSVEMPIPFLVPIDPKSGKEYMEGAKKEKPAKPVKANSGKAEKEDKS